MKFRAVMIEAGPMREFTNIVSTISRLSKECIFRLSSDKLYLIVSEDNSGPAPPMIWCEMPQSTFFSEYQINGIDDEYRDIYLGIVSANLSRSLVTLKTAKCLKMKLTKKQCPCLTLEIEMMVQESGIQVSKRTLQRRLAKEGLTDHCPPKNQQLTEAIKKKLLASDHEDRLMSVEDWSKVCFSDKSTFEIRADKSNFDKRRPGEKFHLDWIMERVKHPIKIRVWSVISGKGVGRLYIVQPSSTSQQIRHITHDIPVAVIPKKLWSDFQEPRFLRPDITIELPALKQIRTSIDRMKCMSSEVVIRASAEGRLTLQIKTDLAKVSTRFKDLKVETFQGPVDHSDSETETQTVEDSSKTCYCRVDAKKFSMFLSADQISHNRTICSIVHKKLVILSLETEEHVKLQCFITGIVY